MKEDPMVSVCMTAYQHEECIREALEGVLMQKCKFEIEVIVANDHSADNTEMTIRKVIAEHPNGHWIKHTTHTENKGLTPNFMWTLSQCQGKYIALCDGDDYWTDPLKLQKQVDFLEQNEEYILCFHDVQILRKGGNLDKNPIVLPDGYEQFGTLVRSGNYIHTPSILFRKITEKLPPQMIHSPLNDYFLSVIVSQYGKIGFLDEIMAVYRSGLGAWGSKDRFQKGFDMSVCNALLYDYFLKSGKDEIAQVLLRRVINFLKKSRSNLTSEQLHRINTIGEIFPRIIQTLFDKLEQSDNRVFNLVALKRYIKKKFSLS